LTETYATAPKANFAILTTSSIIMSSILIVTATAVKALDQITHLKIPVLLHQTKCLQKQLEPQNK